jgi:hypothetical protein
MNPPAPAGAPSFGQRETGPPEPARRWLLHHGEALAVLRSMPDASIDDFRAGQGPLFERVGT